MSKVLGLPLPGGLERAETHDPDKMLGSVTVNFVGNVQRSAATSGDGDSAFSIWSEVVTDMGEFGVFFELFYCHWSHGYVLYWRDGGG